MACIDFTLKSISIDYTPSNTDVVISVETNTATASVEITLPLAYGEAGRLLVIKDGGGNASTNNILVSPQSPDTMDGKNSLLMQTDYGSVFLIATGSTAASAGWALVSMV
jgi:hypothetical protein